MRREPAANRGPRMIDVARLAGVSHQTVSRVVNQADGVTPEVRERVEQAIQRLRYRRNPAARALATSRSMSVGVISFGLAQYGPAVTLTGIAEEARRAGYATNIVSLVDVDRETMRRALDHLTADSVDGIIALAPIAAARSALDELETDVPLVIFHPGGGPATERISTDEVTGARIATELLLDAGHPTVHHVSGPVGWLGTTARLEGWSAALAERRVAAPPPVAGDWTTESGYLAGRRLARSGAVHAVFAANDQMALGVMKAFADVGLRVPGEVSVVGFDGVPESAYFRPALTTVDFDFAEVGRLAVDQLLRLMDGDEPGPAPPVRPRLVLRESATLPQNLESITTRKQEPLMSLRPLGRTGLDVSSVCVGTSALGSFPAQYGYEVDEDTAVATIHRVFEGPFTFIDTSNEYGGGASEERIGRAIAEAGGIPEGVVIATKVDPIPGTTDFSGDRVRRSVEESLERLGLDRLQLVYLHDPEKISFEEGVAPGGPLEALIELRDQGVIASLGVAGGPIDLELQYLATDAFDAVISHNRYTLVEQTAEPLLDDAARRGVAFVNAAPFGGGMLVKGPRAVPRYCYAPVAQPTIDRVLRMEALCERYGVPLAAAALQFSVRDDRVASTIVGMSRPSRVEETIRLLDVEIPDELWSELLPLAAVGRHGIESDAA